MFQGGQSKGFVALRGFSAISEEDLDNIVREYVHRHGGTTGQTLISGYIRSLRLRIQRKKIHKSLVRIDPKNSALRMGIVVHRRKYYVQQQQQQQQRLYLMSTTLQIASIEKLIQIDSIINNINK